MTNEIYYQAKNPISHIAFANWLLNNYDNHYEQWDIRIDSSNYLSNSYPTEATTLELFQIWCKLECDKTLAIDKIDGTE